MRPARREREDGNERHQENDAPGGKRSDPFRSGGNEKRPRCIDMEADPDSSDQSYAQRLIGLVEERADVGHGSMKTPKAA